MVESPPDLHVVSNLDWGEFHRRVPMRRDPQVPFSGLRWRLVQACVVTLSYVMLGGVCVLMSGPLLLIAALHFYPPF